MKNMAARELVVDVNGEKVIYKVLLSSEPDPAAVIINDPAEHDAQHEWMIFVPLKDWPRIVKAVNDMQQELELYPESTP